jgi:hypothetical protein
MARHPIASTPRKRLDFSKGGRRFGRRAAIGRARRTGARGAKVVR